MATQTSHSGLGARPCIQLYLASDCVDDADRVKICHGTRPPDCAEASLYEPAARLPRGDWRGLSLAEAAQYLRRNQPADTASTVSIVKCSDALFQTIRSKTITTVRDAFTLGSMVPPPASTPRERKLTQLYDDIVTSIRGMCSIEGPLTSLGLCVHQGNLKTLTHADKDEPERGERLIGLHVDSWEGGGALARQSAGNRISINVGLADRHFLFVPVPLAAAAAALKERGGGEEHLSTYMTGVARAFLVAFPETPVIRCSVKPGEAYIAPTETTIHDGSSEGEGASCHITLRGGYIYPRA